MNEDKRLVDDVNAWLRAFRPFDPANLWAPFGRKKRWNSMRANVNNCGVFVITILATGQMLVGAGENAYVAGVQHLRLLKSGKHRNPILQKAFDSQEPIECAVLEVNTRRNAIWMKERIVELFDNFGPNFLLNYNYVRDRQRPERSANTKEEMLRSLTTLRAAHQRLQTRVSKLEKLVHFLAYEERRPAEQAAFVNPRKTKGLSQLASTLRRLAIKRS